MIFDDIKNSITDGEIYIVCATDEIKNCLAQQLAKYSFVHSRINLTGFLITLEELKEGKKFKKIEFVAS